MLEKLSTRLTIDEAVTKSPNLTGRFSSEDLAKIGNEVFAGYERDEYSRTQWKTRTSAAMDLAMQVQADKNFPWPNCSNVVFPLVTIASLQFSSRAYPALIEGPDIVKYRVVGPDPEQKLKDRAQRIGTHMSYQVLEEDTSWEEQHDRLFINVGIVGCNFIKSYFSPICKHNTCELVMARDFVIDYWAKDVDGAARKTQIIPMSRNEIYSNCAKGIYRDVRNSEWFNSIPAQPETNPEHDKRIGQTPPPPDRNTPYKMLEQHVAFDFDHDGYAEPYIVIIESATKEVVRITARWEDMRHVEKNSRGEIISIKSTEYFTKYGFIPAPDGGIYDIGFGVLLGPLNDTVDTGINQLIDCGTMYSTNGGFLARGVKIRGGVYTFAPNEWKRVDSPGDDLRKNVVPNPVKEPSEVMLKLLSLLIEYAERIAGTTDTMVGVSPGQNTPAETSRNTVEQGQKVYKGIYKRIWRSMKEEFKKLHKLNALYLPSRQRYGDKAEMYVTQEDYLSNPDHIIPAADPEVVSDVQRMQQAATIRESAHQVPGYDIPAVEHDWLRALKKSREEIARLYPGPDKVPPLPNPKAALEQMKLQGKQMEIEFKKWEFVQKLQAEKAKTQAEITNLNAQTVQLLAQVQTEQVKTKIAAFEAIVTALQAHNEMLTNGIEAMKGVDSGSASGEGAVGTLEGGPGNQGAAGVPAAQPAKSNGAMGGQTV